MNDLPQNELLSAYLDGELTAAEQAEVERLLAADPAARQLLDELRALSAALQALPRQELGEDLSPRVLREAERRRRGEKGPDSTKLSPVPLVRSVFRRFATRRNLVWLGITAAMVLMIKINEWQQRIPPAGDVGKEIALAPAKREALARTPGPPPSIQAAPEAVAKEQPGGDMLVVHCDISREAARNRAFDKLLDANGIAWQEESDRGGFADETDVVYVEATPAQVSATLAGLAAQPDAFLVVSVAPEQKAMAENATLQEAIQRQVRDGDVGHGRTAGEGLQRLQTPASAPTRPVLLTAPPAVQSRAQRIQMPSFVVQSEEKSQWGTTTLGRQAQPRAEQLPQSATPADAQRQLPSQSLAKLQQPTPSPQSPSSTSQQRVLFVLRVVEGDRSPAAEPAERK